MIRTILTVLYVFLFLTLGLPVMGVEWIIGKFNRHAGDIASLRTVQWGFKCCLFISGVKLDIRGLENLPTEPDKPALLVGNHNSFFDVIIMYTLFPERTGFIAKKAFKKVPSLNLWMMRLYCLFLDRKDTKQGLKIILKAIDYVKEGISIFVFPEGTRSKDGKMIPFKAGAFKISTKTGCPIIPVVLSGTADIFENHLPKIKKGNVVITIGEPIDPNSLEKEEKKHIADYTHTIMEDMLVENDKLLENKLNNQKALEAK
ncbi:MAG: 1-acyl-sn-glycerol-3-phosphate acyltransferase [Lachnospiraceae bacterium]|nr:1-acyl-sn-glycerol-3-phosphate acyltransferase [Lachnospiraceae bacterium]